MIFTDTITIYNHYKEDGHDKWQRTVLFGCQWRRKIIRTVDSSGKIIKTVEVSVTIPYRSGYVSATEWIKLADRKGKWTVGTERNLDILTLGKCEIELSETYTPKKLMKDRQDVIIAGTLADNTNRDHLKHWRVTQ